MEKTGSYGKDGQLWKRRAVMEKTDGYGKDGRLWKRRAVMEKTGSYGKDGHLWKRQALLFFAFLHSRNNIAVTFGLTTKS